MSHPYVKSAHKNDPKWAGALHSLVEEKAHASDLEATVRNYGSDKTETAKAAYEPKKGR